MLDTIVRDFRMALRGLARQPLFTLVAAGSLAIGIGANTTVFSVANTLLLQPLPEIPAYDRVVELGRSTDGRGFDTFSYPDFLDIQESAIPAAGTLSFSVEIQNTGTVSGKEVVPRSVRLFSEDASFATQRQNLFHQFADLQRPLLLPFRRGQTVLEVMMKDCPGAASVHIRQKNGLPAGRRARARLTQWVEHPNTFLLRRFRIT